MALPIVFSDGRINAITIATDRQGGFATAELQCVAEVMPVLARLMEVHAVRRTAKTILETYLGRLTGERVLNGLIHRGDGDDIHAVIWLRPARVDGARRPPPRRAFLELLNEYLECMAGAVMAHNGGVLKFIGDAILAIFPLDGADASVPSTNAASCFDAIAAARGNRPPCGPQPATS